MHPLTSQMPNRRLISQIVYAVAIIVICFAAGIGQYWISVGVTLVALAWSARVLFSWPVSIAAAIMTVVLSVLLITTWSFLQPILFTQLILLSWILLIGLGWVLRHRNTQVVPIGDLWIGLVVTLPGVLMLAAMTLGGALFGLQLAWVVLGDAQFNTVLIREIIQANGADPIYIWVPSLIQILMAAAAAAATGGVATAEHFVPMLQAQAQTLAVVWATTSLLFGCIAIVESRDMQRWIRALLAMAAALFPLSWYILSFSIDAGFYNTSVALLGLALMWLFWREFRGGSAIALAALWLSVIVLAAAWVPLAVVPGLLAVYATATFIFGPGSTRRGWPIVIGATAALIVYGLIVLLPSYLAQSSGLSQAGRMAEVSLGFVLAVLLSSFLTASLSGIQFGRSGTRALGLFLVAGAAALGLAFLLMSNRSLANPWSYYPAKMGWLLAFFVLFLLLINVMRVLLLVPKPLNSAIGVLAAVGLTACALWTLPPIKSGVLGYVPLFGVARNGYVVDAIIPDVARVVGTRTIYYQATEDDFLINQWAFQWASVFSGDPIRSYAYSATINTADGVCEAATTWGGSVTVVTANSDAVQELTALCGSQILRFDSP